MIIVKGSSRSLRRRRLETVAVILVISIAVLGLSTIRLASSYSLDLAGKAWVYELGNIVVVTEGSDRQVINNINSLPGVDRIKVISVAITTGIVNNTPISIALIYNPSRDYPITYIVDRPGRVLLYRTTARQLLHLGDRVKIPGLGDVTIDGLAIGVSEIVGGVDAILLTPQSFPDRARGEHLLVMLNYGKGFL